MVNDHRHNTTQTSRARSSERAHFLHHTTTARQQTAKRYSSHWSPNGCTCQLTPKRNHGLDGQIKPQQELVGRSAGAKLTKLPSYTTYVLTLSRTYSQNTSLRNEMGKSFISRNLKISEIIYVFIYILLQQKTFCCSNNKLNRHAN